jgi:S-adenosylmethionine:tRNA ribosyltransferase-isomerase
VDLGAFDYHLPPGSIAQRPAEPRESSRLLVIDRTASGFCDRRFVDLPGLLAPGDLVVVNDSRVIPARVLALEPSTRRPVELLFVEPLSERRWRALVKPGRRARVGTDLVTGDGDGPRLRVVAREPDGSRLIESDETPIEKVLDAHGVPPLPPYIARHASPDAGDRERYQTVYARPPGSVAAPTAGLHFSDALLDRLRARGIEIRALTLHVGPATFQPIRVRDIADHRLPAERVTIAAEVATAINAARATGRRVVAVGTTTTRALEGAVQADGSVGPGEGRTDLYIRPGHRFRVVGALVTNFHLPRSSLLVLVSAFAGRERILAAYRHAVEAGYRFYSYGDATLIV